MENVLSPQTAVISGVTEICMGYWHTCVRMSDSNGVRCWGDGFVHLRNANVFAVAEVLRRGYYSTNFNFCNNSVREKD